MLSGLPEIDLTDWENNTDYSSGYTEETPVIQVCSCLFPFYILTSRNAHLLCKFNHVYSSRFLINVTNIQSACLSVLQSIMFKMVFSVVLGVCQRV